MQKLTPRLTLSGLTLCAAATLVAFAAQAEMSAEDKIKVRQSGYTFIGWNMGKIYEQVVEGSVPYNPDQVAAAADAIAAIANSGMGVLHAPGTDEGTGWKPTRLKAEFFDDPAEVRRVAGNFARETAKLRDIAKKGDLEATRTQFREVGKTCKACHENFRRDE